MGEAVESQGNFEGWAVVEMMGHRQEVGFVRTVSFGQAVLFQVDRPGLPERDYVLESPEYVGGSYAPAGAKVRRAAVPGRSCLVAQGSLYAISPCTEEAALAVIERSAPRPLMLLEMPRAAELPAAPVLDEDSDWKGKNYGGTE